MLAFLRWFCGLLLKSSHYSVSWLCILTPSFVTCRRGCTCIWLKLIGSLLYLTQVAVQSDPWTDLTCLCLPNLWSRPRRVARTWSEQAMSFQLQYVLTLTKADHTTPCLERNFCTRYNFKHFKQLWLSEETVLHSSWLLFPFSCWPFPFLTQVCDRFPSGYIIWTIYNRGVACATVLAVGCGKVFSFPQKLVISAFF